MCGKMEYCTVLSGVCLSKGKDMISAIQKVFSSRTLNRALEQFGEVSVKNFMLFSLIGILLVTLVVLLRKALGKETQLSDILTGILLAVYCSIILQLTLVCRQDNSRIGIELDIFHGLRGPDSDFHWLMIAYVVLNCMLFIPFGFILSLFSFVNSRKKVVQLSLVTLMSLIVSLLIEVMQLITGRGYYETQDLVFNTLGGMIGWVLFVVVFSIGKCISGRMTER